MLSNGKAVLVGRYPVTTSLVFANWMLGSRRTSKSSDRYHVLLSGDFYNLTNRGNVYSNPNTNATIDYTRELRLARPAGISDSIVRPLARYRAHAARCGTRPRYGFINQIAPGSTPFAFQAGAKFIF